MASATFTLRAVDQTRAAFASVQNSLQRLETQTKGIAKITKLAFGGEAVLGALNMMKQRLDKVATAGEDMGFDDQQIASAIQMERAIDGILNLLMQIPLILSKVGIRIASVFDPSKLRPAAEIIREFKFEKAKKEIAGMNDEMVRLQFEFAKVNMTERELADALLRQATSGFLAAVKAFEKDPAEGFRLQKEALQILLQREQVLKGISKEEKEINQQFLNVTSDLNKARSELDVATGHSIDLERDLLLLKRQAALEEQTLAQDKGKVTVDALGRQTDSAKKLTVIYREIAAIERERRAFGMEFGNAIAQSFEDAIVSGNKLREVIRALAQDLLRMIFREQVTKPLAGGLGNFFADLFTGKAMGGPVAGGTPYLVGERGPELFVPSSSGSIVPNNRLQSSGAIGGGVTINYHIAAGVSRSELAPILESERRRLKAEIPDMVRRGGAYRAAFA